MAWKKLSKPQSVKANHALHAKFALMEAAPNDRPMKLGNRKSLRSAILEGRFRNCNYASAYCVQTGKTYRVNGKHTSSILNEMNGEAPKDLWAIVEEYECDTLEDVAKLYSTFDVAKSARTTGDINCMYAAACPELEKLPHRVINLSVTGMEYFFTAAKTGRGIYRGGNNSPDAKAQRLLEFPEYVLFVARIVGTNKAVLKKMGRGPIAAAMFGTWQKNKSMASDFWIQVRDESATKGDATRTLASFLFECGVARRARTGTAVGENEIFVKCIHAWNAWRKGEATSLKYYANKPVPAIS